MLGPNEVTNGPRVVSPRLPLHLRHWVNRNVKSRTYRRWRIADVPAPVVRELGWEDGDELSATVQDGRLVLERKMRP